METKTNPKCAFIIFLIIIFHFLQFNTLLGTDTISSSQSLSGDQTIESARGVFVLGFFKPGNSPNWFIGMWYKQVTEQTVIWVANRDKPISDRFSSELKISDGNLVLFNESKIPIWSTNASSTTSPLVQAVLLDDGNFVFNDGSNSTEPLWQSFDHPTDTWLPGNRFGYNKVTKTKKFLASWKSSEDPLPGLFSFEMEPNDTSYVTLWNRSKVYWNTGPWTGTFTLAPERRPNIILYFELVSNENETSFIMHATNSSVISHISMDVTGQMKQHLWRPTTGWTVLRTFPRQQCQVYASCGAYGSCYESLPFCRCLSGFEPKSRREWDLGDYSSGCSRRATLRCSDDKFLEMPAVSLPENRQTARGDRVEDCKSRCLNNCSCNAYSYEDNNGCSIWTEKLLNLKQLVPGDNNGGTLYIRLAASELPSTKKNNKGVVIGVVVGSVAGPVLLLVIVLFITLRRRKSIGWAGKAMEGSLTVFGYRDLKRVTQNFSERLGGGGFGSVFKGTLLDSTVIAVKKLESVSQGEKEFRTEVATIGTIQHVNLVQLRGFCCEGDAKMLVYDYMPNGSLGLNLFNKNKSNVLDWKTRYQIALGTARGLEYLHERCRNRIIHCDVKPENILLDAGFCPKVADFGLAKLVGREFSRVLTTMRGTRGYLAPEWIEGVAITPKADVYSYGMTILELFSGRRNSAHYEVDGNVDFFPNVAANAVSEGGDILGLLDPALERNGDIEEIERVCRVACWCIQDDEAHRPWMSQVVQMLEGIAEVTVPPIPQSLRFYNDHDYDHDHDHDHDHGHDHAVFFSETSSIQSSQAIPSTMF